MRYLLVSATEKEIGPLLKFLNYNWEKVAVGSFQTEDQQIEILITGVGMIMTAYHLGVQLSQNHYDLALHVGIAGALDRNLSIGNVYQVIEDQFADLGAEDQQGQFLSIFDLGLLEDNHGPLVDQKLPNPYPLDLLIPEVTGYSVNKVAGTATTVDRLKHYPPGQLETMEGAAFFYACLMQNVPFTAIRSISNFVEPRNRDNWEIGRAVKHLNDYLIEFIFSVPIRP